MNNVFVRINEKQFGPLSHPELKSLVKKGKFRETDLVWNEDEDSWLEAGKIDEIKSIFNVQAPAVTEKRIIAVGGGKGGVGKTVITASMGIGLAALGYDVILVDADFGGANLHTAMGILQPEYSFLDYYTLSRENLDDILLQTPFPNLKMISGACGTLGMANPKYSQKLRLIKELRTLNADFIILDLGAGSSFTVIDFFLAVDEGMLIMSPEPTAVQETFDFLKICLMRKLHRTFKDEPEILNVLNLSGIDNLGQLTLPVENLVKKLTEHDSEAGSIFESILEEFKPRLLLNMVMNSEEIKEGAALKTAAAELLSIDLDFAGYIEYDSSIRESVKDLRPFILNNPKSKASRSLAKIITIKILQNSGFQSLRKKIQLRRNIKNSATDYPTANQWASETICSVKCFYWDDCEFQNGGFPCSVRHLESIFNQ
jgi:flagellar biosynthesis protein FlhG